MRFILITIGVICALDVIWWLIAARLAQRGAWRHLNLVFIAAQLMGLLALIFGRLFHTGWDRLVPRFVITAIFIWHTIAIPLLIATGVVLLPLFIVKAAVSFVRRDGATYIKRDRPVTWTRRDFLGAVFVAAPPIITLSLSGIALRQLNNFRVRHFVLPIRDLPRDLDEMTITQVSDMHVGRFTSGRVLKEMVKVVNELDSDLLLLTGDLINDALADLSNAIDIVRSMDARAGVYLIEGNHDLIEDGAEFERRVKASGIPFLLDEVTTLSLSGSPVQLLGLSWTRARENRDAAIAHSVKDLLKLRDPDAFPILLAHHPHAFDAAAEAAIPLTLSGHTHGGQLMLNERLGFGPALFRYWSGRYEQGASQLIVSNGVGNWFPLRTAAPAEIVHLTLRRA